MEVLHHSESALHRTVQVVCGLLAVDLRVNQRCPADEGQYRYELVACMMTSRVNSASAEAAVKRLASAQLLDDSRWQSSDGDFEGDIAACLRSSSEGVGAYRFPNAKAAQLTKLRAVLRRLPLRHLLQRSSDVFVLRRKLVEVLPGVGPKQASMFLRNIGVTYSLAILDAHVVRFLHAIHRIESPDVQLSSMDKYERIEVAAIRYAQTCQQEVGYLDWAIWITMKALREMRT